MANPKTATNPHGGGRPPGPQPHLVKYPGILAIQRRAYSRMRAQAKFRREEFILTWQEFYDMWAPVWEHRGRALEQLCLSRIDWEGEWSIDNVQIITREEHFKIQGRQSQGLR
jgi:hypothetical protein